MARESVLRRHDLTVSGAVTPASSPVGGSHVWRLRVSNSGYATASRVVVDVQFTPNVVYGFSQVTRGSGCVPSETGLRCELDSLGHAGSDTSTAEVLIGTNVKEPGDVSLTAIASFEASPLEESDPTPADNTLTLRANGSDLTLSGAVAPASSPAPVGGWHIWTLRVSNAGYGTAHGTVVDVQFSPNVVYGFSEMTEGSWCVPSGTSLRCELDSLGPAGSDTATTEVAIGTNVLEPGEVSLTATASVDEPDPTPSDNTLTLRASASPAAAAAEAVDAAAGGAAAAGEAGRSARKARRGRRFTFSLPVTRSDTGARLLTGKMDCDPTVSRKTLKHTDSFKSGKSTTLVRRPEDGEGQGAEGQDQGHGIGSAAPDHTYTSYAVMRIEHGRTPADGGRSGRGSACYKACGCP